MKHFILSLFLGIFSTFSIGQNISTFENFELPLDTFLNGTDQAGGYQSGSAFFPNKYSTDFGGLWQGGWAISSMRDSTTSGFENLYSAKTGRGFESATYAVGQQNAVIHLTANALGKVVNGFYITNGTYAYASMKNGDDFAKKFGGETGNDPDFFKLEIRKYRQGELQVDSIEFYLADFRFEDNSLDYIIDSWQWVDLTSLGNVDSLHFALKSSDIGDFGINTPLFFCIDNLETTNTITDSKAPFLPAIHFKIFPNPVANQLFIELKNRANVKNIQIFDLLGKLYLDEQINSKNTWVNVAGLESGLYILRLTARNNQSGAKIFVKK